MSQFVVVNDEGHLYGGFSSEVSKPVWFKTKRDGCGLTEELADAVVKQLKALGYEKVVKRPANGVLRKWVPSDLDASTV